MSYAIVRPPHYRLPDAFYAWAADTYKQAAYDGHHDPCKRIADASGYSLSTVHRWIATARSKGFLEATTQGRVTGLTRNCRTCGRPL